MTVNSTTIETHVEPSSYPVQNVTVYNDRAEITRTVSIKLDAGSHQIFLEGLSTLVDTKSVRVSGKKGDATILDVSTETKRKTWEKKAPKKDWQVEREKLTEKKKSIVSQMDVLKAEKTWLIGWGTSANSQHGKEAKDFLSPESLAKAAGFMSFYHKELNRINEDSNQLQNSVDEIDKQLAFLGVEERNDSKVDETINVQIVVAIEVQKKSTVVLSVSYLVSGVCWKPSYDCRVDTKTNTMQLIYYGFIEQSTNEDWVNAQMSLSTATPSVGGSPPFLPTSKVSLSYAPQPWTSNARNMNVFNDAMNNPMFAAQSEVSPIAYEISNAPSVPDVVTATAHESASSTTFVIEKTATISSDGKPHKVTIAIIEDLRARFAYSIVPSKSVNAFLKASVTNTTKNMPFLAGPMSVFMDGNYIATSEIKKTVSPLEAFALFLGSDASIKVEYPSAKKLKETKGMFGKTNVQHIQKQINIKNNKSVEISVVVYDQLPLSDNESVQVKLIEPTIKDDIKLNSKNNIEWRSKIKPGESLSLAFSYDLEWPKGKEIQFY